MTVSPLNWNTLPDGIIRARTEIGDYIIQPTAAGCILTVEGSHLGFRRVATAKTDAFRIHKQRVEACLAA